MYDAEFEIYTMDSIVPLFPGAKFIPGNRVIIKINSGPGQTNIKLLAKIHNLRLLLYPGVPNTTSDSKETDKNYGPFKTIS